MSRKLLHHILLPVSALWFSLSAMAQESARPRDGDGIYSFLRRHNRGEVYYEEFLRLNKGKFGKNNILLLHHYYTLPPLIDGTDPAKSALPAEKEVTTVPEPKIHGRAKPGGKGGYEPLFGTKLSAYEITSEELKGAVFYIVSGHGGPDPGAIGRMGNHRLYEDEYAYDIALRLARGLMMRGARVHIIIQDAVDGIRDDRILFPSKRETCMGDPIPLKQYTRLAQRCDKINALEKKEKPAYSRAIFLHLDSRTIHKRIDVFFYHSPSKASKKLAQTMRKTFVDKYRRHQPSRGFTGTVAERSLYVLNQTNPVALFVELGNIQNSYDQQRFILANNRQALANWLCDGLVSDYKNHRK